MNYIYFFEVWALYLITIGANRQLVSHQLPIKSPSDLALSEISCNDSMDYRSRRCTFKNVIIFRGEVWYLSESYVNIPPLLCSAIDGMYNASCSFRIESRENMYNRLCSNLSRTDIYGINTESALHFASLSGDNPYHVLFEEMIPIYEILKSDPILSKWLNSSNNNTIKVLSYGEGNLQRTNPFTLKFLKEFFPHIDFSFRDLDWYESDDIYWYINNKIYMVNHLVAGSNHSCVHYYYCSRSDFQTPYIASEFRDYMLSKVGISPSSYHEKYKLIKHPNNTIQFKFIPNKILIKSNKSNSMKRTPGNKQQQSANRRILLRTKPHRNKQPKILIIQRKGRREISNMKDILQIISSITGKKHNCIYYENYTLTEQIKLTFSTDILIMIHGGGLANAFYLPPYATLIDIYPYTYPYHMYGLVNWMRYALRDVPIAHAPFDIIEPTHMTYCQNHTLPLCIMPAGLDYWHSFTFFWHVDRVIIDPIRFKSFFKLEYKKWHSKTNYITPMTRETFLNYSKSFKEPWYNNLLRNKYENESFHLTNCEDELSYIENTFNPDGSIWYDETA
eukprot:gene5648-11392_t